ncbi:MAG TPA: arginine deiminase family protein [Terriglobales bacterium]|nr:arginine deiminase family protein [Terriglobales bacterium]
MDRLYDVILVRPPSDSYKMCVSSNPDRAKIDVTLAKRQHRDYVSLLKESNLEVIELVALSDLPDSVFAYDPALLGVRRCVIGRFGEKTRRGENQVLATELVNYQGRVGEMKFIQEPGTLEGGDILVTPKGVFVGESIRTNRRGIEQLTKHLNNMRVQSIKANTFHFLCACSYLDDNRILVVPDLLPPGSFPGFDFVLVPEKEAYASEALYLGEKRVLIPSGYPETSRNLKRAGYKPVETDLSEFYKGDGGVSCLSAPVYKTL